MRFPKHSSLNTTLHEVSINYLLQHIVEGGCDNHYNGHKRIGKKGHRTIPDIITSTSYIEVETITDKSHYENITDKKKLLYIAIPTLEAFDEINLISVAPFKAVPGVYDFRTIFNISSNITMPVKENNSIDFENNLKLRDQKTLETTKQGYEAHIEKLNKLTKKYSKKIPKLETQVEELKKTVSKLGTKLYTLKKKQKDLNTDIETSKEKLSQTRKDLKQLNEKEAELSTEQKRLFWIKINLGNVGLNHKSIFDCALCDEPSTIGIVINKKEYGLCDYHYKKVIGT